MKEKQQAIMAVDQRDGGSKKISTESKTTDALMRM